VARPDRHPRDIELAGAADKSISVSKLSTRATGGSAGLVAAEYGLGALTAAQILLSWSHAGRIRSEAAFGMKPLTRRPLPRDSAPARKMGGDQDELRATDPAAVPTRSRRATSRR
jgi:hypothetical protein